MLAGSRRGPRPAEEPGLPERAQVDVGELARAMGRANERSAATLVRRQWRGNAEETAATLGQLQSEIHS
jgi:hypothetical protein